jgi:protein TonB
LPSQAAAVRQPEPTVEATEPAPAPVPEFPVLPDQTAAVTAPSPPRRKPVVKEPPKHVTHRTERPREPASEPTPASPRFAELLPAGIAGAQYPTAQPAAAAVGPAPVPRPDAAASYQAVISAWLESHKRYPSMKCCAGRNCPHSRPG